MKTSRYLFRVMMVLTLVLECAALTGCDGGVAYEGETPADESAEPVTGQEVGRRTSTYGKAVDQAESIVDQNNARQQEMLDLTETSEQ